MQRASSTREVIEVAFVDSREQFSEPGLEFGRVDERAESLGGDRKSARHAYVER